MKNLYLDIHVLQTIPPSCVNRDDTGSPKTCIYGGKQRARVSSQAWKQAIRKKFPEYFCDEEKGIRTKKFTEYLKKKIQEKKPDIENDLLDELVKQIYAHFKSKMFTDLVDKNELDSEIPVLLFFSTAQIEAIVEIAINDLMEAAKTSVKNSQSGKKENKKKKEIVLDSNVVSKMKQAFQQNPSLDMILFGRMVAGASDLTVDACCQVAHSISTHPVDIEYDYFTAMDDLKEGSSSGASMIQTNEFDSATLYRYATLNVRELAKSRSNFSKASSSFIKSFALTMPSGKQNSYANQTIPGYIYVTLRDDQPVSLVSAFEEAITDNRNGYLKPSVKALEEYSQKLYSSFVNEPVTEYVVSTISSNADNQMTLKELLEKVEKDLEQLVPMEN